MENLYAKIRVFNNFMRVSFKKILFLSAKNVTELRPQISRNQGFMPFVPNACLTPVIYGKRKAVVQPGKRSFSTAVSRLAFCGGRCCCRDCTPTGSCLTGTDKKRSSRRPLSLQLLRSWHWLASCRLQRSLITDILFDLCLKNCSSEKVEVY